ncbi:MAG: O-Antigen ligase [Thermoanaerobacteraceae bacterium]|nr:O-Antigen ligase [Thermoanaerobacteraceae bacterium]
MDYFLNYISNKKYFYLLILTIEICIIVISLTISNFFPIIAILYIFFMLGILLIGTFIGFLPAIIIAILWTPRTLDKYVNIIILNKVFDTSSLGIPITEVTKGIWLADILIFSFFIYYLMKSFKIPLWLIIYFVFLLPSIIISLILGYKTIAGIIEYFRLPITTFVISMSIKNNEKKWERIFNSLVISILGLEIMGLFRWLIDRSVENRLFTVGLGVNTLAVTGVISLPLIELFILRSKKRYGSISWLLIIIPVFVILLTGSRQGFAGLILYLIYFIYRYKYSFLRKSYYFIFFIFILGFKFCLNYLNAIEPIRRLLQSGIIDINRIELIKGALNIWIMMPLTGVGLGNFGYYWPTVSNLPRIYDYYWHCHNLFLMFLSESGILGLIGFIIFLVYIIYIPLFNKNLKEEKLLIASIILLLIIEMVDYVFWDYRMTLIIGCILGLIEGLKKIKC